MLLDEGRCTFAGDTYSSSDATCEPAPVQHGLPLLVGGGGELRTMKVAARYADVWHCWADPATFAAKNAVLDRHCAERRPRPGQRRESGRRDVAVTRDSTTRQGSMRTTWSARPLEVVERLLEFRAAGADEFIVRDEASVSLDSTLALIDEPDHDVLPALDHPAQSPPPGDAFDVRRDPHASFGSTGARRGRCLTTARCSARLRPVPSYGALEWEDGAGGSTGGVVDPPYPHRVAAVHELTREDARRIAVRAQLLDATADRPARQVRHLTLLQVDHTRRWRRAPTWCCGAGSGRY